MQLMKQKVQRVEVVEVVALVSKLLLPTSDCLSVAILKCHTLFLYIDCHCETKSNVCCLLYTDVQLLNMMSHFVEFFHEGYESWLWLFNLTVFTWFPSDQKVTEGDRCSHQQALLSATCKSQSWRFSFLVRTLGIYAVCAHFTVLCSGNSHGF